MLKEKKICKTKKGTYEFNPVRFYKQLEKLQYIALMSTLVYSKRGIKKSLYNDTEFTYFNIYVSYLSVIVLR